MPATITVTHLGRDRFEVAARQHRLWVDQPVSDGGSDTAPTPTELFVSSLAACVAFYARRYLARHDLPTEGLTVEADYAMATKPVRVGDVSIRVVVPSGVPDDSLDALAAVAGHCTVHNTLETPPAVRIDLVTQASGPA